MINKIKKAIQRVRYGIDPCSVLPIQILMFLIMPFSNESKEDSLYTRLHRYRLKITYTKIKNQYLRDNVFDFKGILLPDVSNDYHLLAELYWAYEDILFIYCRYNDNYEINFINKIEPIMHEGPYHIKSEDIDMIIQPGDVVIDAGAWIGDYSAYASKKGAIVYAFECSPTTLKILQDTVKLNQNIHIVPYGLGDKKSSNFSLSHPGSDSSVSLHKSRGGNIQVTTIDDFVRANNIHRIDFIKADIEGMERKMLEGAAWVLKNFQPKLSICTYHLPDDPIVLEDIIKKANPKYKIMQRRKKLFAWVN